MDNVLDLKSTPAPVEEVEEALDEVTETPVDETRAFAVPTSVAWTAHHPLEGAARMRHYGFLGALVVAGAGVAIWQATIIPFLVMLCGAAVLEVRERWGKPVSVEVDDRGITVDGNRYEHASFASFHVHRMPDDTLELSLKSERRFLPHIRLPLGEQDPDEVHAVLSQYLLEGEHAIPLVEYMIRKPQWDLGSLFPKTEKKP